MWSGALALWRDHLLPVWAVSWAPAYGHYFATGGADRTARIYAIDHAPNALRVFTGHKSDVTCVAFHPNINYLATGSADRCVRLYDVKTAKPVRIFSGHKGSVQSLAFSPCGRFLASGAWCGSICVWDLAQGGLIGQLGGYCTPASEESSNTNGNSMEPDTETPPHENQEETPSDRLLTGPVVSLEFCPSGNGVLAAGGLEGALRFWNTGTGHNSYMSMPWSAGNLMSIHRDLNSGPVTGTGYPMVALGDSVSKTCLIDSFYTRKTSVLALKYIHPRLILCAGPYNQN
ncbi:Transcription initiation factor TFIID subunit 5 [Cichlidogyrus casuarinus]|uniref:Transcription initiation factor TFIID subunit 5 n=1 Tax=Cichlidogyrus casuarinus TaxID=1844966 RepID=A0ABD2PX21_9PLAT